MSSIRFSDVHRFASVTSRERSYANRICNDLMLGVLRDWMSPDTTPDTQAHLPPLVLDLIPEGYVHRAWEEFQAAAYVQRYTTPGTGEPGSYVMVPPENQIRFNSTIETWFKLGEHPLLLRDLEDGTPVEMSTGEVALNTALVMGCDEVALLARLHGQCEMYLWVDGPNRAWLADLIESGIAKGIFRKPFSPLETRTWQGVSDFLRSCDDQVAVTDYSVSDSFPSSWFIDKYLDTEWRWDGVDGETWYDQPLEERWEQAVEALHARERTFSGVFNDAWTFELRPDGLRDVRFMYGHTAFTVSDYLFELSAPRRAAHDEYHKRGEDLRRAEATSREAQVRTES